MGSSEFSSSSSSSSLSQARPGDEEVAVAGRLGKYFSRRSARKVGAEGSREVGCEGGGKGKCIVGFVVVVCGLRFESGLGSRGGSSRRL